MLDPHDTVPSENDLTWLGELHNVAHPINPTQPLVVRSTLVKAGGARPGPTHPFPEQHSSCEIGMIVEGKVIQFIGSQKMERAPGSLLVLGPGLPHYATDFSYPYREITVHFLPILLLEMGPCGDGAKLLSRFTGARELGERILHLPTRLRGEIAELFQQMMVESQHQKAGSELLLRARLMDILVKIHRWEDKSGRNSNRPLDQQSWLHIEKTFRFIHENYAAPLYVEQMARAAGLTVNRLQSIFRETVGMSCVHYLRAYRISQAKALLCMGEMRVTEIAFSVGFETLSHFNTSFRNLVGMSPTEYAQSLHRK
jgi:AraC-like DNA-binding protein